jgi:hypothetical protein
MKSGDSSVAPVMSTYSFTGLAYLRLHAGYSLHAMRRDSQQAKSSQHLNSDLDGIIHSSSVCISKATLVSKTSGGRIYARSTNISEERKPNGKGALTAERPEEAEPLIEIRTRREGL